MGLDFGVGDDDVPGYQKQNSTRVLHRSNSNAVLDADRSFTGQKKVHGLDYAGFSQYYYSGHNSIPPSNEWRLLSGYSINEKILNLDLS